MNITQAKTAMRRLVGPTVTWRYSETAPTAEEREAMLATLPALQTAYESARDAAEARRRQLLSDPEYLRLAAAGQAARKALGSAQGRASYYRVQIGKSNGMFNHILAEGDNWQDAIDKLKAKATGGAA